MGRILRNYLPSTAITFTAVVFFVNMMNLLEGGSDISSQWILQVLGCIVAITVLDGLLGCVRFKSYKVYVLVESVIAYGLMLGCAYLGRWFSFQPERLLPVTVIFLLIMGGLHWYFNRMARLRADEINRLLQARENV